MSQINDTELNFYANGYEDTPMRRLAREVRALRERAEPVSWDGMPFTWEQLEGMHGADFANGYVRGWERKCESVEMKGPLYTAPPAPVVADETFDEWSRRCEIQLTLCRPEFREVAEITWNACREAMLAAPGKDG
ncbi:hypothetical protein ACMS1S_000075 [Cronobacter malonaticus]